MAMPCLSVEANAERPHKSRRIPKVELDKIDTSKLQEFIQRLERGIDVVKHGRGGRPKRRTFTLDPSHQRLTYTPTSKSVANSTTYLRDVCEIRMGHNTKVFERSGKKDREQFAFSLIRKDGKSVDIEVESAKDFELWITSISYLIRQSVEVFDEDPEKVRILQLWMEADRNDDKKLDFREVSELLQKLNLSMNQKLLRQSFNSFDKDGSGALDYPEFVKFYQDLTEKKEMFDLFVRYAKKNKEFLTAPELLNFVRTEQGEPATEQQMRELVLKLVNDDPARAQAGLTKHQFSQLLADPVLNGWWNPEKLNVYQDMSQPLNHYYIASSHNTYLSGDQLQSESRVEMYRDALLSGCRCVELDCWDGPNTEPIVYHGHTRTTKILFKDIIQCIGQFAFEASPFPVILSLEVHTSMEGQKRMAMYLRSILKDKLADPIAFTSIRPSQVTPHSLRNKVLVKGHMLPPELEEDDDDDEDEKDEAGMPEEVLEKKRKQAAPASGGHGKKIARELSDCVFMRAKKMKSPSDAAVNGHIWDCTSFSEGQLAKVEAETGDELIYANIMMFSRIYPAGTRFKSDNYMPTIGWNLGCQLVALNYQTMDFPMRLNEAKFHENGKCGYLLKPESMRRRKGTATIAPRSTLLVRVISGSQIPKPNLRNKGEIIDPFVSVFITGTPEDTTEPLKTKVVNDNGFHPIWDQEFTFSIQNIELAHLTLRVIDKDTAMDDDIAEATIPVLALRNGYRSVPLVNIFDNQPIDFATLFCHFRLETRTL
eukprot:TRINITY_DN2112_c0_g1_i1.p1 TRINITY_DN2112_c0_g1~~TRINITY_DN2112_c0_g1_i1.p1  ORF type:complete len:767 (+),score=102.82 TRINITY_DN2112_c0_g1_i1:45-2345(+)